MLLEPSYGEKTNELFGQPNITVKGHKAKSAKKKVNGGEVRRKMQGCTFRSPLAGESHQVHLIPTTTNCDLCEVLSMRAVHWRLNVQDFY